MKMIHSLSDVKTKHIGDNTQVWQYVVILENAKIGCNCNINSHVFIENEVFIGNHVTIKCGVQIWDGITINDYVFVGPNVTFSNDKLPRSKQYMETPLSTEVGEYASIGAGATILPGINIGKYAVIGAGSVVTKNVPEHTVWYGNPARFRAYITKDNIMLTKQLIDLDTDTKYRLVDGCPVKVFEA